MIKAQHQLTPQYTRPGLHKLETSRFQKRKIMTPAAAPTKSKHIHTHVKNDEFFFVCLKIQNSDCKRPPPHGRLGPKTIRTTKPPPLPPWKHAVIYIYMWMHRKVLERNEASGRHARSTPTARNNETPPAEPSALQNTRHATSYDSYSSLDAKQYSNNTWATPGFPTAQHKTIINPRRGSNKSHPRHHLLRQV